MNKGGSIPAMTIISFIWILIIPRESAATEKNVYHDSQQTITRANIDPDHVKPKRYSMS